MEINTTNEIVRFEIEWGKIEGITFQQINQIHNFTKNHKKYWIAVDELIKHIEESRSPDGDYADSDCIIKHINKELKKMG